MYIRKVLKASKIKFKKKFYDVPEGFIGKKVVVKKHGKYLDIFFQDKLLIQHLDQTPSQKYINKCSRSFRYGGIK